MDAGGKAYPGSTGEQQRAPSGSVLSGTPQKGHDADGEASPPSSNGHAIMQVLLEVLHEMRVEATEDLQRLTASQKLLQDDNEGRWGFPATSRGSSDRRGHHGHDRNPKCR